MLSRAEGVGAVGLVGRQGTGVLVVWLVGAGLKPAPTSWLVVSALVGFPRAGILGVWF